MPKILKVQEVADSRAERISQFRKSSQTPANLFRIVPTFDYPGRAVPHPPVSSVTNPKPSRCTWVGDDPLMQAYHDEEWGVPQRNSRMLWEMLMLEGFQAGLSWAIVLRKREAFRKAFAGFDPDAVARFTSKDVDRLLTDPGIIRARAKIEATITGARLFREMRDRGEDFAAFCWSFTEGHPLVSSGQSFPVKTPLSERVSEELKGRGFKFVGPTIVYAWMQAVGIVNDHSLHCFRRDHVAG